MSLDITSESSCVCYVHCNFCSTILAVSVPWANIHTIVTVRCGHCANLLSVNMGAFIHTTSQESQTKPKEQDDVADASKDGGSSSKCNNSTEQPPWMPPIPPPEKRQRAPSAYNRFIKEEIQRIKASNPQISHREAFSTAAKNWAHFPHIHFGLNVESNRQGTVNMPYGE